LIGKNEYIKRKNTLKYLVKKTFYFTFTK
jgi:hypothetical protein